MTLRERIDERMGHCLRKAGQAAVHEARTGTYSYADVYTFMASGWERAWHHAHGEEITERVDAPDHECDAARERMMSRS